MEHAVAVRVEEEQVLKGVVFEGHVWSGKEMVVVFN
jgi:hypothetical protein